jgi:hypothetical protein
MHVAVRQTAIEVERHRRTEDTAVAADTPASVSVQRPRPVSWSGVMFEVTATPNDSRISTPPARCLSAALPLDDDDRST